MNYREEFLALGINIPEIILPNNSIDMNKWSVVACDQFTSQPDYWKQVENIVGSAPSTLKMILPEVYLGAEDETDRIKKINNNMYEYLQKGILQTHKPGFIYVERTVNGKNRKGLVISIDLEKYDYSEDAASLIRATEGTVIDRLPPRIRIRKNAPLEIPHVMVLIDDADKKIIEPIKEHKKNLPRAYDFKLMQGGGSIAGYHVNDSFLFESIISGLKNLKDPANYKSRYRLTPDTPVMLFAIGDGNHSLASAKAHWENIKAGNDPGLLKNHPARYALVELVNIHDKGLEFEPIHRVIFNADTDSFFEGMKKFLNDNNASLKIEYTASLEEAKLLALKLSGITTHVIPFMSANSFGTIIINNPPHTISIGSLQGFIDFYCPKNGIEVDYIHGSSQLVKLGTKKGNIGFYMPSMDKGDFFKTIINEGVLPKKSFSMGEAEEKRYYIECRRI